MGSDAIEDVDHDRLCFLGAAPFRTPTAKGKACSGRSVEVHPGPRARARVKRVFVSDDEGPAHDETLCGLIDDAEPSRERTGWRRRGSLRSRRTATHVKWADAVDAAPEAPPAKRRRPARAVASAVAAGRRARLRIFCKDAPSNSESASVRPHGETVCPHYHYTRRKPSHRSRDRRTGKATPLAGHRGTAARPAKLHRVGLHRSVAPPPRTKTRVKAQEPAFNNCSVSAHRADFHD